MLTVPGLRLFLSTLSLRRATVAPPLQFNDTSKFLSTLSLRRATLTQTDLANRSELFLSTLSLRRATSYHRLIHHQSEFLSTLSLRRATRKLPIRLPTALHFYPRSPCGERRRRGVLCYLDNIISIHALLAESDLLLVEILVKSQNFYPRSPCGERPLDAGGNDLSKKDFYPRSPCGERPYCLNSTNKNLTFLSTLSLRRATRQMLLIRFSLGTFLSTLSLRRATVVVVLHIVGGADFYPRSPCGERQYQWFCYYFGRYFYPRSPCGERLSVFASPFSIFYFYPRSPCGERQFKPPVKTHRQENFYPRSPCGERLFWSILR